MDVSKLTNFGWKAEIGLKEGIELVYKGLSDKPWFYQKKSLANAN